jgi:hypothetical protein
MVKNFSHFPASAARKELTVVVRKEISIKFLL